MRAGISENPVTGRSAPEWIAPFRVSRQEAVQQFFEWLAQTPFAPESLLESAASFHHIQQVYAPAFLFRGHFRAPWSALFGEGKDPAKIPQTEREVAEWRPATGTARGDFTLVGSGLRRLPDGLKQGWGLFEPADFEAEDYKSGVQDAALRPAFECTPSQSFYKRARPRLEGRILRAVRAKAAGLPARDWTHQSHYGQESFAGRVPLWRVGFFHQGREYAWWGSGLKPGVHAATPLPVERSGLRRALSAFLPFWMLLALLAAWGIAALCQWRSYGADAGLNWSVAVAAPLLLLGAWLYGKGRKRRILALGLRRRRKRTAEILKGEAGSGQLAAVFHPSREYLPVVYAGQPPKAPRLKWPIGWRGSEMQEYFRSALIFLLLIAVLAFLWKME